MSYSSFVYGRRKCVNEKQSSATKRVRDSCALHYTVFKQYASHLPHEANVEQLFLRSGNICFPMFSDPNMDPGFLATLTSIAG
eukprot:6737728-Prymnesium_polylepis.1